MAINLPLGKWSIYGNEEQGILEIKTVDNTGNLTGTAFGDNITGVYNASAGVIHFSRKMNTSALDYQVYNGNISVVATNVDAPEFLLAGSYHGFPFQLWPWYGWYATIKKVIP
ncbi:MAG TPA: hypothetical protein VEL11_04980 [Candidatus Bathyarchaeia archaeon]|nr:hypothetical protein [Candidatus Bathyarchaeia archaeon]